MSKLLDYLGLQQFLNKLKTQFVTALGTSGNYLTWTKNGTTNNITVPYSSKTASIPFGYVDNTSTSTVYTVTVDGITELRNGVCFRVTNSKVTSESGCTINVNQLGAKPMYSTGAAASRITTTFTKDRTYLLIYNETRVSGGCWDIGYLSDSNTTYSAITLAQIQAGTATTSRTVTAAVLAEAYNISNGTITIGANSITPITQHQDISGKEDKTNKVTSLSSSSTDTQYPSAKCVYDNLNDSKPFIVTGTTWNNETLTVDKTAAEVYAAHNSGRVVYLRFTNSGGALSQMQLQQVDNLENQFTAIYFTSYCINNQWVSEGTLQKAVHTGNTINFENFGVASQTWVLDEIDNEAYNIQNQINNLKTSIVNHGTSDTTFALTPNVYHIWGSVSSLTLTLGTPADNTIVNEYIFEFTSGSTATTLSLPSSVKWAESCGTLSVEASKTYQISIVDNIGLWTSISNS